MNQAIVALNRMERLLLKCNIKTSKLINRLEVLGEELKELYLKRLLDIELHEYREFEEIYNLIPEEQWQQYEVMGIEDLREQQLIKVAKKNLCKIFKERITDYGKKTKTRTETDTQSIT